MPKQTALRFSAAAVLAMVWSPSAFAQFGGNPASQFAAADANKDGIITREEYRAQRVKNFAIVDKNGDGFINEPELAALAPNGQAKMMVGFMVGRMDTNKDKKISKAEWAAAPMPIFDRADTNRDSKVTQDEIKKLPTRS